MRILKAYLVAVVAISCCLGLLVQKVSAQKNAEPLEVLMITGGGPYHDYPTQKNQLEEGLTDRIGNIKFTIDHNEGESEQDMSFKFESQLTNEWASQYDLVLYNNCNLDMGDADHVEQIMGAHAEYKVPAILLHCPMHLHRNTSRKWFDFTGAVSYQHELDRTPFTVEVTEPAHPIMANFPENWRTPKGELYMPVELKDTAKPLARAYGNEGGEFFPVAWTNRYKGVRIFSSTLGHHNATMGSDVNLNLVAAGILWAAGKLKDDGHPIAGYSGERGLGWISLFDGKTLQGWRASETTDWANMNWFGGDAEWPSKNNSGTQSFAIEEGKIIADGPRSHLFYEGKINGGSFQNFEFKTQVQTHENANSGIFFHTRYKEQRLPIFGYEADINTIPDDSYYTGNLNPGTEATVNGNVHPNQEYFDFYLSVDGNQVVTKINGETITNYTEPTDKEGNHQIHRGKIALQVMNDSSPVYFRNILIRVWPD